MVCVWLLICGSNSLLVPNLRLHREEREGRGEEGSWSHSQGDLLEPLPFFARGTFTCLSAVAAPGPLWCDWAP